jgi:hypothetical protein
MSRNQQTGSTAIKNWSWSRKVVHHSYFCKRFLASWRRKTDILTIKSDSFEHKFAKSSETLDKLVVIVYNNPQR